MLIFVGFSAISFNKYASATSYYVSGTVTNSTGAISGATIYVNNSRTGDSISTTTDVNGYFSVDVDDWTNGYEDLDLFYVMAIHEHEYVHIATGCGMIDTSEGQTVINVYQESNSQYCGNSHVEEDFITIEIETRYMVVQPSTAKAEPYTRYTASDTRDYRPSDLVSQNYFEFNIDSWHGYLWSAQYQATDWINITLDGSNPVDPVFVLQVEKPDTQEQMPSENGWYYTMNLYVHHVVRCQQTNEPLTDLNQREYADLYILWIN